MNDYDVFRPYSSETRGDLEKYLREQLNSQADNLFYGPKYFFELKDKDLLIPLQSFIRINLSPSPDITYFVNKDFLLEGIGGEAHNMSQIQAEKGVFDPNDILETKTWSIVGLDI